MICRSGVVDSGVGVAAGIAVSVVVGNAVAVAGTGVLFANEVGVAVGVRVIKSISELAVLLSGMLSVVVVTLAVLRMLVSVRLPETSVWLVIVITPPTLSVATVPVNALLVMLRIGLAPLLT